MGGADGVSRKISFVICVFSAHSCNLLADMYRFDEQRTVSSITCLGGVGRMAWMVIWAEIGIASYFSIICCGVTPSGPRLAPMDGPDGEIWPGWRRFWPGWRGGSRDGGRLVRENVHSRRDSAPIGGP